MRFPEEDTKRQAQRKRAQARRSKEAADARARFVKRMKALDVYLALEAWLMDTTSQQGTKERLIQTLVNL